MNVLFASSEVVPFIKTGGLADVAGSLPPALAAAGHDVRVVLPLYGGISEDWRAQMTFLQHFDVPLAWRQAYCGVFELRRNGVTFWFLDNEYYFKREGLYGHFDDCERFAFFSRAVLTAVAQLDFAPDMIHCNDWQCAMIPVYLLEDRYRLPQLGRAKTVFTIHNIEYQGRFSKDVLGDVLGLDESYFNENMLAHFGSVDLMKGALWSADHITTVSPTYAEQLCDPFYAHGLDGVIRACRGKLRGILNGIDTRLYDPKTMPGLAANFTPRAPITGKKACKAALQSQLGLSPLPDVPLIACVSRLVGHKGFGMVTEALEQIMAQDVHMVVLGTGERYCEQTFLDAAARWPGSFSAQIRYAAELSNAIYAGADLLLMPSVSEPCGLSQMIAMRFGTLPIVRETGGLRDSVPPYNQYTGEGRGFTFAHADAGDMLWAVRRALEVYRNDLPAWRKLQRNAMTADFSRKRSAKEYMDIYRQITE